LLKQNTINKGHIRDVGASANDADIPGCNADDEGENQVSADFDSGSRPEEVVVAEGRSTELG
jgi:hypothetical protein